MSRFNSLFDSRRRITGGVIVFNEGDVCVATAGTGKGV
jgi:hypothetical protein